jgi:hypothetical protein
MNIAGKFKVIEEIKGKIEELAPRKDWDEAFLRN